MVWGFFSQTPYNLTFHCLKLSDSIRELALEEEEKGLEGKSGAIPETAVNVPQISSDLQSEIHRIFYLWACH